MPVLSGPVSYVNPLVGTAEHGHTYPGATVPFGLVQLSPDTPLQGWDGSSGYHYSDSVIRGFSHTHLMGTGVGGLGDILLMPTVGEGSVEESAYSSPFSHTQEVASPGYYRVFLQKPGVTAELSATARAGIHRYTFPASNDAHIVLDLQHGVGNSVFESSMRIENSTTISGTRISDGWGGRRAAYFVMQFSKPFDSSVIEQDQVRLGEGATQASGKSVKSFVSFKTTDGETILVRVGISGTSVEGARRNLSAEIPNFDFDAVHTAGVQQWNDLLGRIQIESKDPKIRRTFATNYYQSCLAPVLFNDADGTYRGLDKQNHPGAGFQNYTTFSLWDTFRAQHPLLTVVQPERVPDMVNSMLAHYKERGAQEMPVWPLWGNETGTMIGYHSAPVIADAFLKGFKGFDAETAYQDLRATALNPRNGQDEFGQSGYIFSSSAGSKQSVSRSLEFAYDDWCIAQMAQKLGHTEDAQMFLKRSANYRNLFDSTVGFMRGRLADGTWRRPFNPKQLVWADYTEANAWQYSWTAMQDSPGLVKIMGGDAPFINKLETLFNEKSDVISNIPDITGLIGQYAHGNEPVHHVAYLYNYAGAPWRTQARVRQVMDTLYNDTPAGDPGNNDCGQMSAWYVWSAMGFYPVNPVGGIYVLGSPSVDKATIRLNPIGIKAGAKERTFTMIAANNSPKNVYIQSASLNGKPLQNSYLTHSQLMAGGVLRLQMGIKPNLNWGKALSTRPPSGMPANFQYAALPTPSLPNVPIILKLPIRVIAGSEDATGGFVPDFNMEDGSTNGNTTPVDVSAPNAGPEAIYQSERYGSDFSYRFPVPKTGRYTVRLHFAEIFGAQANERVENIDINGTRVLENFSVAAEAGQNKAVVKEFTDIAPNAQGEIVVRIAAAPGSADKNAKISGIEILAP
ncbi:GH92 family glycosyl hydrolase [Abditibacterium utsteinense]|nr:GH92 family glycosyl hydrolase [Abditibacterium utsteinense]